MKKISSLFAYLLFVVVVCSCDKDEIVGPAGPAGVTGPAGAAGESLLRQGFVEGIINGNRSNGDTIIETFKFEYTESLADSRWGDGEGDYIEFSRRSIDENSYFEFYAYGSNLSEGIDSDNIEIYFSYLKDLGNGTYLRFGDEQNLVRTSLNVGYSASDLTITNYSFNKNTGNLKFDYKIEFVSYENTSGNPATVTGKVDVILGKEVYRKSNNQ